MAPLMTTDFATADLYDDHAAVVQSPQLQWLHVGKRGAFSGPAFTLKVHEDNSLVREAFGEAGDGRVLVIDGGGSMRRALIGDRLVQLAIDNGWAGALVYGCIRDRAVIDGMDFGIHCLGTTPCKTVKRGEGQKGIAVEFGGARFEPGHWVYADADGVLVAPKALG